MIVCHLKLKKKGLGGVSVAVCIDGSLGNIALAELCGFDIITGYNYHNIALPNAKLEVPISELQSAEVELWEKIKKISKLPYIPVSTLN